MYKKAPTKPLSYKEYERLMRKITTPLTPERKKELKEISIRMKDKTKHIHLKIHAPF
jgi:hypothetical protein